MVATPEALLWLVIGLLIVLGLIGLCQLAALIVKDDYYGEMK
jgi:hypothetical protein